MTKTILKDNTTKLNKNNFESFGRTLNQVSPNKKVWINRFNFHGQPVTDIIFDYNFGRDYAVIFNGNSWVPINIEDEIYFES